MVHPATLRESTAAGILILANVTNLSHFEISGPILCDPMCGGGTIPTPLSDSLESFFFAETIKYLFLLFYVVI